MRDVRPSLLERLFGVAAAVFGAALLLYIAVRLIEAVLPALLILLAIGAAIGLIVWWWRSRMNSW